MCKLFVLLHFKVRYIIIHQYVVLDMIWGSFALCKISRDICLFITSKPPSSLDVEHICYNVLQYYVWHLLCGYYIVPCSIYEYIYTCIPWKAKTKITMVFRMIHVKDSLLPMGKVWSLDFLGAYIYIHMYWYLCWRPFLEFKTHFGKQGNLGNEYYTIDVFFFSGGLHQSMWVY